MEPNSSHTPRTALIGHPLARGFLAALLAAGFSLLLLTSFNLVEAPALPWLFPVIFLSGLFASQLQERMRTLAESGAPK